MMMRQHQTLLLGTSPAAGSDGGDEAMVDLLDKGTITYLKVNGGSGV